MNSAQLKNINRIRAKGSYLPVLRRSSNDLTIDSKRFLDFTSFDFFNLNENQTIRSIYLDSFSKSQCVNGSMRSPSGTSVQLQYLEIQIAKLLNVKTSVYCSSKNQAVFSCITNLLTERDTIYIGVDSTSPAMDAAFLVGAHIVPIDCTNPNWISLVIEKSKNTLLGGKCYCFYDELSPITGVYQDRVITLTKLKQSMIVPIVDVSLSLVIEFGPSSVPVITTDSSVDAVNNFFVGSFGFSLPGIGAFLAANFDIDTIKLRSSSLFNEPAISPALADSLTSICSLVPELNLNCLSLEQLSKRFNTTLSSLGLTYVVAQTDRSPIFAINCKDGATASSLCDFLFNNKILATRVPRGTLKSEACLVRFVLSIKHEEKDFLNLAKTISEFSFN